MTRSRGVRRAGLALLEVLVALLLLSLLVVGYLRLFQGGHHLLARSREWSDAVGYAIDAMERAKGAPVEESAPDGTLPDGWAREVSTSPWQPGMALVTVTVALPAGGTFSLYRLRAEAAP
jgi:type II secretory pathway component PulK